MSGDFGYGQLDPNDTATEMSAVAFIVRQMMAQMSTIKLVQVKSVNSNGPTAKAGTVDVLPLVNQVDGNNNSTVHGTVYGLPWARVQGGKNAVICDPIVDDIGYVVISDRDISNVKSSSKQSNPGSFRRFDIADGIYVGGCLNVAPDQYLIFTTTGVRLVDKNGNSITMASTGIILADQFGNQIQMKNGAVNIVTASFQVNGTPVTVP